MADEDFTLEELELLDEMIADLKAINQRMTDMIERDKNGATDFNQLMAQMAPSTTPLHSKIKSISNIASPGEKNSCTKLILIDLTPLKPSLSEVESTMVMEQKDDQIEDPVVESLDLVNTKWTMQVTDSLNNYGWDAEISDQFLKPFILEILPTECKVLQLSHCVIRTRMNFNESSLVPTDENQLLFRTPVYPNLPPKPPDVSYSIEALAKPTHSSFKADISQGRLESLLNYQSLITDLTGLPMSSASFLEERTATVEAMSMSNNILKEKTKNFIIASNCHPQTIDICKTRAAGFDIKVVTEDLKDINYKLGDVCGVFIQYPGIEGGVLDYGEFIKKAHANGIKVVMATELLALTVLKPPGELEVDIFVGSAQRIRVPMSYGGHAKTVILARVKSKASQKIICSNISNSEMLFAYFDHLKPSLFELRRSEDGKVTWSVCKRKLHPRLLFCHSMIFTHDSSWLIVVGHDRRIYVVDVGSSELVHTFTPCRDLQDEKLPPTEPPITRLFNSSDRQWLAAVNCFGDIYVFNLEIIRQHWFISRLEGNLLCAITGFDFFSLQPNASAAGEYVRLMVISAYHLTRGDHYRNVCSIPVSVHGTNPANAATCGMKIVTIGTDAKIKPTVQFFMGVSFFSLIFMIMKSMCCCWSFVLNFVGLNMRSIQSNNYGAVQIDNVKGFHQDMMMLFGLPLEAAQEYVENLHSDQLEEAQGSNSIVAQAVKLELGFPNLKVPCFVDSLAAGSVSEFPASMTGLASVFDICSLNFLSFVYNHMMRGISPVVFNLRLIHYSVSYFIELGIWCLLDFDEIEHGLILPCVSGNDSYNNMSSFTSHLFLCKVWQTMLSIFVLCDDVRKQTRLVMSLMGPVAYKLLLPPIAKIHPVFICSQLKLCQGNHSQPYISLPIVGTNLQPVIQPAFILQSRVVLRGQQHLQRHLIQWEGLDASQATWEDHSALQEDYPSINLEDKVVFNGEGIVTNADRTNQENDTIIGANQSHNDTTKERQAAADPNDQAIRKSNRICVTNSRLHEFDWSRT